jgi:tRNA threonylcarbamoyladenosine biosynthesis protein TsaB
MLLLSADTSGKNGSVALCNCHEDSGCDVLEVVSLLGGTFSAQLIPQIASLLSKHGFSKHDLGALAVATGPGSFTGLRVGLAAMKALGEVLKKPIAGVSLLAAVAAASSSTGSVLALMDAGRREVFMGRYNILVDDSELRAVAEDLARIDDVAPAHGENVVTPDENLVEYLLQKGIAAKLIPRPGSDAIARLGWRKIQRGDAISPEQLEANYIRRIDAEIFSKP